MLRCLRSTHLPQDFSQQHGNTVQDRRITMKKTWPNARGVAGLALVLSAAFGASGAWAADAPGVAFVYLGNPGDAGWTYGHDQGSQEVEAKFGNQIRITRVENVRKSADSERVSRDLANKGTKIIFGTPFGFQDFELKVAKDFPDTVC